MTITPIITTPLQDIVLSSSVPTTNINLLGFFDDPSTTGKAARFQFEEASLGEDGIIDIVLFDQAGVGAPLSVANFLNYVNSGRYTNTIIHRSIPNFVIQGGGFVAEDFPIEPVQTDPPVQNEFSSQRSNLRGTIAYAKQGTNPNSATSQWFFNLGDNSSNLDNQNGGFTVFGQVLGAADLATVDAIAQVRTFNIAQFSDLPVLNTPANTPSDLVRLSSIFPFDLPELEFSIVGNTNPTLVNVVINGENLDIAANPNQFGSTDITINATSILGVSIQDTLRVTIPQPTPFDPAQYGASYPDLIRAYGYNLGGLTEHYFQAGIFEGRNPDSFDEKNYLASYDDLLHGYGSDLAGVTRHYIEAGFFENRRTNIFDGSQYLATYRDLFDAFGNNVEKAKDHFINHGFREKRSRDSFREDIYIASNPDLLQAYRYDLVGGTQHYLNHGIKENRQTAVFDPVSYLNRYPDLKAAFGDDTVRATYHYIVFGFDEGRVF
jgi:peptidyl-prolyl cis-trans isomerase A (cyclophilin A)